MRSMNTSEKSEIKAEGSDFDCLHWGFAPDCSLQSLCSPCGDVLERCAFPADASSDQTQALLEQTTPMRNKVLKRLSQSMAPLDERRELQMDEAKIVADAQLDLAFSTLNTLYLRKQYADVDGYKFLMDACGRCGSTAGATELMANMRQERILINGEIYSKYLLAFSVANEISPDEPIESPLANVPISDKGGLSINEGQKEKKWFSHLKTPKKLRADDSLITRETSEQSTAFDGASSQSSNPDYTTISNIQSSTKKRKKMTKREKLQVTEQVGRHLAIGDSLLEYLYNDLKLDASNACPRCSKILSEDEVMAGWNFCSFTTFDTKCNNCNHSFVPSLVVTSSTNTFEGSQGIGTPLFCELFSPWVLRKQLYRCDIDDILQPDWRKGTDINSTLWWNLIFAFKRQKLPITFLLQGTFKDRLIMPMDAS